MIHITSNPKDLQKDLDNKIIITISKNQISKFFQFLVFTVLMTVNIVAVRIESVFLKEFLISQVIIVLILFLKYFKLNTIIK